MSKALYGVMAEVSNCSFARVCAQDATISRCAHEQGTISELQKLAPSDSGTLVAPRHVSAPSLTRATSDSSETQRALTAGDMAAVAAAEDSAAAQEAEEGEPGVCTRTACGARSLHSTDSASAHRA